ncbi:hypothetical protein K0M31_000460 [Melipona bicolor]|uniref:Uncharacterized protein n=1 Tax=Melipona bicolor TaxID=60889 RepID=A0AA40KWV2_9HYME|nr:hypothetical protein K0M31_000460 [Melipona bicolor]
MHVDGLFPFFCSFYISPLQKQGGSSVAMPFERLSRTIPRGPAEVSQNITCAEETKRRKRIYLPVSRTILRAFNLDQLRVIEWSIPVRALCPSNQRNIPRSAKECENCLMFSYSAIKAMIRN